jgi:RNA polymerase sigma factor (TIGR02999 family)
MAQQAERSVFSASVWDYNVTAGTASDNLNSGFTFIASSAAEKLKLEVRLMDSWLRAEIAEVLNIAATEEASSLNDLAAVLYDELRRMAKRQLYYENAFATLGTTSLVHEVYLRLAAARQLRLQDRSHLLALAARLMRHILVDHARSRAREKRSGGTPLPLEDAFAVARERSTELVRLDECLDALSRVHARKARVVEMRFFGGLSVEETAQALDVSADTVVRDWRLAKVWLIREMTR